MHKPSFYICAATLAALATTLLIVASLTHPASAAQPSPPPPVSTNGAPPSPGDHLIALPVSLPNPDEIPPGLTPEQAANYARSLTYRQARPLLAELMRLRAEGKIAGFEVLPDLHGVAVEGGGPEALERLSRLRGVAAVLPLKDEPPACAAEAAEALPEQVLGLSRVAADAATGPRAAGLAPQATDPSIDAYVPPASTYSSIMGHTTPNTAVTMRILRGGRAVATGSTVSSGSGSYSFSPSWQDCPTEGYNWTLRPGDVVEVTAHGSTVSTVVVNLSAWVDPGANSVAGQTDPGRSAEVRLYDYSSDPCSSTRYNQTVGTDGSGNFSADFSGQVDFDGQAAATVYARDANGNSTYDSFYAYRIRAEFDSSIFSGYLKPGVDFTATLSRTGSIISTDSGKSSASGYYYGYFTDTIQAGDVIQVSGGGVNLQYTATGLDVALNHATDQATGATGAGRQVQAWFYKRDWGYVYTSCSGDDDCASTTADGSGAFTLDTDLDLVRGDGVEVYVYDAEGNHQFTSRPVPAIVADLDWDGVSGYWGDPSADHVTVVLKDSGGAVKDTDSWVGVDPWDGEFDTWMASTITPTDIIEVTDGTVTETMTVQNLTARLDGGTGHLTGNAASGHLLAELDDFRRESGGWWGYCAEADVAGGPYDLTFSGAQVGGQDDAEVWNSGPDGHYTYRYPSAFTVNAQKGDDYVWGYSETPGTQVTVTLKSGVTTKAVYTTTSDSDGYYDAWLSGGTPVTITQGDTLQVQTGDGDSVSLSIPELTANADGVNNRVYGKSPAGEPVRARVRRHYNEEWYEEWAVYSRYTTADGSGNYSASFDGLYWSFDCSAVDVGHRCIQPAVYYYNAAGHHIWWEGPYPSPADADIYESDGTYATASAYAGVQSHTFHAITDTDWVSFTVPAMDVTTPVSYRIETFNLGWDMDTYLYLYDTDGSTLLAENDDWYDLESRIDWTPPATGTYYVLVEPYDEDSTEYCDAVYDLMILPVRAQVYLPLVARNY